ncbi:Ger(x)C family spore germination protein [Paenibacillaceae bacterium]|nr:Ger(x)C family spore germination protein [Paenibacillaceae bacterium]
MKRVSTAILVGCLVMTLFTGCWNRRELNELGILSGAAIDKVGDEYQVAAQVVIPDQVSMRSTKGGTPVTMYKASAPTLFEAFRKLTTTSPRKIYTAQIRVLVLGESIAREGIAKVMDLLVRNPETRTDYVVVIAKNTEAENVLKVLTPLEKIPADSLFDSLDTAAKIWAPITKVTADKLVDQFTAKGINPVLPGVGIINEVHIDKSSSFMEKIDYPIKLKFSGLAVFRKDKFVGWLGTNEGRGYNYITNNVEASVNNLPCQDGNLLSFEIIRSTTNMKSRLVNDEPIIEIKLEIEANISEISCDIDINNPHNIEVLEKNAADKIEKLMQHTVQLVQKKYKVDIFGFGQSIYKNYPDKWKLLEKDWDSHFANLKVAYDVRFHIRTTGMTTNTLERTMKENQYD